MSKVDMYFISKIIPQKQWAYSPLFTFLIGSIMITFTGVSCSTIVPPARRHEAYLNQRIIPFLFPYQPTENNKYLSSNINSLDPHKLWQVLSKLVSNMRSNYLADAKTRKHSVITPHSLYDRELVDKELSDNKILSDKHLAVIKYLEGAGRQRTRRNTNNDISNPLLFPASKHKQTEKSPANAEQPTKQQKKNTRKSVAPKVVRRLIRNLRNGGNYTNDELQNMLETLLGYKKVKEEVGYGNYNNRWG